MKQLSFLQTATPSPQKIKIAKQLEMFVDGASRGNPGDAGAGIYFASEGKMILELGFYLGEKTNNQAEYLALLIGLFFSKKYVNDGDFLHIKSDSQLLVRQMSGIYKVKDQRLKVMRDLALLFLKSIPNFTIEHVFREKNIHADRMANFGVDKKIEIPYDCITILKKYEIL
jgi:ribonuclease HI